MKLIIPHHRYPPTWAEWNGAPNDKIRMPTIVVVYPMHFLTEDFRQGWQ